MEYGENCCLNLKIYVIQWKQCSEKSHNAEQYLTAKLRRCSAQKKWMKETRKSKIKDKIITSENKSIYIHTCICIYIYISTQAEIRET